MFYGDCARILHRPSCTGTRGVGLAGKSFLFSFLGLLELIYKRRFKINICFVRHVETEGLVRLSWLGTCSKKAILTGLNGAHISMRAKGPPAWLKEVLIPLALLFVLYIFGEELNQRSLEALKPSVSLRKVKGSRIIPSIIVGLVCVERDRKHLWASIADEVLGLAKR